MQDTFARATHSAKRARDDRVSCIQVLHVCPQGSSLTYVILVLHVRVNRVIRNHAWGMILDTISNANHNVKTDTR